MSEAASDRAALIEQIERQEGQLARISAERREAEARLATLRRQLADLDVSRGRDSLRPTPSSPSEKIALFRSLFRGRADAERRALLEIIEDRYGNRSTILTNQLPPKSWHDHVGDPTIADAIYDRLLHNAHQINLKGESRRKDEEARS